MTIGFIRTVSAQAAAGDTTLTFAATTGVVDNMPVFGAGIPPGAKVSSHTATTVVLSAATTAIVLTGTPITFSSMTSPFLRGDLATGTSSGATGTVVRADYVHLNLTKVTGSFWPDFAHPGTNEVITGPHGATATSSQFTYAQEIDTIYQIMNFVTRIR